MLDSRGRPTVEVEVWIDQHTRGRAIVPSGASTGTAEALELRDRQSSRYDGWGVARAVENVRQHLAPALRGMDPLAQQAIDDRLLELDGTPDKSRLGANALLGVSLAVAHAAAAARRLPLYEHIAQLARSIGLIGPDQRPAMPLPMTNMISGGLHAGRNLAFQDILVTPLGLANYTDQLEALVRIYWRLGHLLSAAGYEGVLVGDEGGYGPRVRDHQEALQFVVRAIDECGFRPGADVAIALDVAASHFYDGSGYRLHANAPPLDGAAMVEHLRDLVERFPIHSIEDGLAEDDWNAWQQLTSQLGQRVRLVGDDLFATNPQRVARGIAERAANALLVKPNQIGTLSETLQTMHLARRAGFALIVSARSGETEDTTIADLAVGTCAEQIKIGSVARGERLAKYNRLLRIDEMLRAASSLPEN